VAVEVDVEVEVDAVTGTAAAAEAVAEFADPRPWNTASDTISLPSEVTGTISSSGD
jgi:hypothetical protein